MTYIKKSKAKIWHTVFGMKCLEKIIRTQCSDTMIKYNAKSRDRVSATAKTDTPDKNVLPLHKTYTK